MTAGSTPPLPTAPAAAGSSTEGSRSDHVHPRSGLVPLASPSTFVVGNGYTTATPAAKVLTTRVAGDAGSRLALDSTGALAWGSGARAVDTILGRVAPRQLALSGRLTMQSGSLILDSRSAPNLRRRSLRITRLGASRWALDTDSASETGSGNEGSIFGLNTYSDTGSYLRNAFAVRRDSGDIIALPGSSDPRARLVVGDNLASAAKVGVRARSSIALLAGTQQDGAAVANSLQMNAATTAAHEDGFGPRFLLAGGKAGVVQSLGGIGSARRGSDDSHDFLVSVARSGTLAPGVRVTPRGSLLMGASTSAGDGAGVVVLADAEVAPTRSPVGAGVLYAVAGALCFRGPGGTSTVVAPA